MSDYSGSKYLGLFATPFMAHRVADAHALNDDLRSTILLKASEGGGVQKTNVGGWHSETGKLEFCGPAGRRVMQEAYGLADEATRRVLIENGHQPKPMRWTLNAWANVNWTGDFNSAHTHAGSTWSGTYYVDTGNPPTEAPNGTPLQLFDPCQGRANTFLHPLASASFLVRPEPGLIVLFPSYVPHLVFAHRGTEPRISIAFNLRREPFP